MNTKTEAPLTTYDDLFEALLDRGSVKIKSKNPKAVRNGLQKAKANHNALVSMMGMPEESRGMQVAAVKGVTDTYIVSFKITNTFSIIEEDTTDET